MSPTCHLTVPQEAVYDNINLLTDNRNIVRCPGCNSSSHRRVNISIEFSKPVLGFVLSNALFTLFICTVPVYNTHQCSTTHGVIYIYNGDSPQRDDARLRAHP